MPKGIDDLIDEAAGEAAGAEQAEQDGDAGQGTGEGEGEGEAEGQAAEEAAAKAKAEEEAKKAAAKPGEDDDPDDAKFLEANKGKAIPYEVFSKKNEKWKKRVAEAAEKAKAEIEAKYKAQGGLSAEDKVKYQRLSGIFENFTKGVKQHPFLETVLVAMGKGEVPDFKKTHEALGAFLQGLPAGDPILSQRLGKLEEELSRQAYDREVMSWEKAQGDEVGKIKEQYGEDATPEFIALVKRVAAGEAMKLPENAPREAYPSMVKIAEELRAFFKKDLERVLAKQAAAGKKKPGANLNNGQGPAGAAKLKIPDPTSPDFLDKMLNDEAFAQEILGRETA